MDLILASTSLYRKRLLQRLQLPFRCIAPRVDETAQPAEAAPAMAARLALAKARVVAAANPGSLVIGSDQVAALEGSPIGKPGTHTRAREQLLAAAGRTVQFHTAVALCWQQRDMEQLHTEPFTVQFRPLSATMIESYLQREQPYDCAGSFKCEGLGIALFESLAGTDPTSLEGLPLIALTGMLAKAGYPVLA
ncbi:Maf family protein [Kineobactrum salinum]|nr:Maf family nucleotide pyrophosphatase [Kineobactrum salinum]